MMRNFIILPILLFLAACNTTQGAPEVKSIQIPELPVSYTKAEALPPLTDNTLGGIVKDAVETDKKYNVISLKYNSLIDFYNCIKVSINNKTDPNKCL